MNEPDDVPARLLFARIDFAIRRDDALTPGEALARTLATPWCYPDGCPASVCGGPHTAILLPGGATVIVPPGATADEIETAVGYAAAVYGEPEERARDDD
jgi:hypothetical protein